MTLNFALYRNHCLVSRSRILRSVVDYPASVQSAPKDVTSHLRGGAGPGRASCLGGATYSHQNSTTPLKLTQIDIVVVTSLYNFAACGSYW
ncbi:hypothetical protein PUN28_013334 [Cardiocondyla obscurior]|uniref:Uncharacterized protein n=1 Tax=Cardiocondyla obscurior TaxID=286306 RepID=A0AAW2FAP2_9HYME